jgi:hypothetical protein
VAVLVLVSSWNLCNQNNSLHNLKMNVKFLSITLLFLQCIVGVQRLYAYELHR